jgi:hypothetical protein
MEPLVNTFPKFGYSGSEANLNNALTLAISLAICIGWLGLLSFSLASILTALF